MAGRVWTSGSFPFREKNLWTIGQRGEAVDLFNCRNPSAVLGLCGPDKFYATWIDQIFIPVQGFCKEK